MKLTLPKGLETDIGYSFGASSYTAQWLTTP
jgi:hypothetical protein